MQNAGIPTLFKTVSDELVSVYVMAVLVLRLPVRVSAQQLPSTIDSITSNLQAFRVVVRNPHLRGHQVVYMETVAFFATINNEAYVFMYIPLTRNDENSLALSGAMVHTFDPTTRTGTISAVRAVQERQTIRASARSWQRRDAALGNPTYAFSVIDVAVPAGQVQAPHHDDGVQAADEPFFPDEEPAFEDEEPALEDEVPHLMENNEMEEDLDDPGFFLPEPNELNEHGHEPDEGTGEVHVPEELRAAARAALGMDDDLWFLASRFEELIPKFKL